MHSIARSALIVSLALGAALGLGGTVAAEGEGHTPVPVCHWVPADGGSFVRIVVDDDATLGNRNGHAHAGHENDLINFTRPCPDLD